MRMSLETIARLDTLDARVAMEIKLLLTKRGQNQAALARAMKVPPMWVSDRLRGRVQWTLNDLARIADALDINVVDLVGRAEKGMDGTYVSVGGGHVPVTVSSVPMMPLPRGPLEESHPGRGWVPAQRRPQLTGR